MTAILLLMISVLYSVLTFTRACSKKKFVLLKYAYRDACSLTYLTGNELVRITMNTLYISFAKCDIMNCTLFIYASMGAEMINLTIFSIEKSVISQFVHTVKRKKS